MAAGWVVKTETATVLTTMRKSCKIYVHIREAFADEVDLAVCDETSRCLHVNKKLYDWTPSWRASSSSPKIGYLASGPTADHILLGGG